MCKLVNLLMHSTGIIKEALIDYQRGFFDLYVIGNKEQK